MEVAMPRSKRRLACAAVLCACISLHDCGLSQDMSVYTTVSVIGEGGQAESVGRSLTLFHAGKVYDYMEDAGELVVFESAAKRFVIVNGNYTGTRIEFEELNQFMKVARVETESYLREVGQKPASEAGPLVDWLRFQLDPGFEENADSKDLLTLKSPVMAYKIETAAAPEANCLEQYLVYADGAAQLNFLLHPGATFPAPRLAVNQALRRGGQLPVSVELVSHAGKPVTLRAKHVYQWKLETSDKQHIHQWERMLTSKQVRWVGFHEYQQRLLATVARRSK